MSLNFRFELDIDEHSPAQPRVSAFRRYRDMDPRWRHETPTHGTPRNAARHPESRGGLDRRADPRASNAPAH